MLEALRGQVEQVTYNLQRELDYSNPDDKIFNSREHVMVGSIVGFQVVLYEGAVCISHPEWQKADGLRLSRYLSTHTLKNKLSEQIFDHYRIPHGYQPCCVMVDVVSRQPYLYSQEDYRPPVKIVELERLGNLLLDYSMQSNL